MMHVVLSEVHYCGPCNAGEAELKRHLFDELNQGPKMSTGLFFFRFSQGRGGRDANCRARRFGLRQHIQVYTGERCDNIHCANLRSFADRRPPSSLPGGSTCSCKQKVDVVYCFIGNVRPHTFTRASVCSAKCVGGAGTLDLQ